MGAVRSRGAVTSLLLGTFVCLGTVVNAGCERDYSFIGEKASGGGTLLDAADHEAATSTASFRDAASEYDAATDADVLLDAREAAAEAGTESGQPHWIALRGNHLCVIDPFDGAVLCRGEHQGIGPETDASIREWHPVLLSLQGPKLGGARALAAGQNFTCAIANGDVYCWGNDPGTLEYSPTARLILSGTDRHFERIEAGEGHVCVSDPFYCWGDNTFAQILDPAQLDAAGIREPLRIGVPAGTRSLALGFRHTCTNDGDRTLCWGLDDYRQCGNKPDRLCTPSAPCATQPLEVSGITGALGLGLGVTHTCAITAKRHVACWGDSAAGQSGPVAPPGCVKDDCAVDVTEVEQLYHVTRLALGTSHSCALTEDGLVYCWGSNNAGQMGINSIGGVGGSPLQVLDSFANPLKNVMDIVASQDFTCALTLTNRVYCWGRWMSDPIVAWATEIPL